MSIIEKFKVKDIRCFDGEQCADIRPVTLLVGENNTGKTALLGCYSAWVSFLARQPYLMNSDPLEMPSFIQSGIDFNMHPYQMGAFKHIIRRSRGSQKRECMKFSLAMNYKDSSNEKGSIQATFGESDSGPSLEEAVMSFPSGCKITYRKQKAPLSSEKIVSFFLKNENELVINFAENWQHISQHEILSDLVDAHANFSERLNGMSPELKHAFTADSMRQNVIAHLEKVRNLAPVCSKPKRIYDPTSEQSSDNDNMPMDMMIQARTSKSSWNMLQKELAEFGENSGMFKGVEIKQLGNSLHDPFQIEFDMGSHSANIVDVGHGVSKILSIVFKILRAKQKTLPVQFLLQTPEIYLHPQAQAELASVIAKSTSNAPMRYLIETHSDYIVNRIRLEIREKTIKPEDVSLVYHEQTNKGARLHNIIFDEMGNVLNAPSNYRDFFLKESQRLLGV